MTLTSTDWVAVPPAPVQTSVKLVPEVRGGVVIVPVVGWVPLQPPDAAQLLAWEASHCKVTEAPIVTLVSLALSTTDGATEAMAVDAVPA